MTYPSQNIKAITEFIFIGQPAEELAPSNLVIVLGNHIIDIMMEEVGGGGKQSYGRGGADWEVLC